MVVIACSASDTQKQKVEQFAEIKSALLSCVNKQSFDAVHPNKATVIHKGKQDENCVAQRLFEEETSE